MSHPVDDTTTVGPTISVNSDVVMAAVIFFFLVVLFFFFLYLYAKHVWAPDRRSRAHQVSAEMPTPNFPARNGLDAAILESLPITIFQSTNFKEAGGLLECSVCLCEVTDGEEVRLLPKCKHGFHLECIDMWFHSHSTCPLCRSPLGALPGQLLIQIQPIQEAAMESPLPPSNVSLFCETQDVSTRTAKAAAAAAAGNSKGMLVIDIPMRESPTGGFSGGQETIKTPPPSSTQMISSSVRRLLSRGKRTMSSNFGSPISGGDHIEEGSIGERRATTPTSSSSSSSSSS